MGLDDGALTVEPALADWLYVYYRLPEDRLEVVRAETAALFSALAQLRAAAPSPQDSASTDSAFSPALLRRPELRDGDITFMEVYGPLPQGSLAQLQAQIESLLPACPLLQSASRHAERFTELPCA